MDDAIALFKDHFQIFARREREYAVRFLAPPYTDSESDSELVYGIDFDPNRIDRFSIQRLLDKFKLDREDFRQAYNEFYAKAGR